jgi:tRNA 2-thiocytidine biosynthesis protein TtcA
VATLPPPSNHRIGKALHDYRMLADGDRVMVAVSGGIDSLVLCQVLALWQRKAPIRYELLAVHLDMGFGADTGAVVGQITSSGLPFLIEQTDFGPKALAAEEGKNGCYHCAKQRRNRLFALAREHGCAKLALGHHRDDIIETLFLNLLYGGNISTMVPGQELFGGDLTLIRPLAYLDKEQVRELGGLFGVAPVANPCPLAGDSKRETVRGLLDSLSAQNPRIKANIFAALGQVRTDYLLKPLRDRDANRP